MRRSGGQTNPFGADADLSGYVSNWYLSGVDARIDDKRRLVIIDDDELTRELLCLQAEDAGLAVRAYEDGEAALRELASASVNAVLADLQMPGLHGPELARRLRAVCGTHTRLLAMSGSVAADGLTIGYDGFLLKPFSMEELVFALTAEGERAGVLNVTTLEQLRQTMPGGRLRELYEMCLRDADSRIGTARAASARRDGEGFRHAAHAIKGSCAMVGATELAGLASAMECGGLPAVDDERPYMEFINASARLKRMLDVHLT